MSCRQFVDDSKKIGRDSSPPQPVVRKNRTTENQPVTNCDPLKFTR